MSKKMLVILIVVLAIANILLYWPGSLFFLNDDFVHIPLTQDGVLFQQRSARPIHELLVRMDVWLWGKQAYGYHITALVLHGIVATQLYCLCKTVCLKWFKVDAEKTAMVAVSLFLIYPQHAESLAWVLGRTPTLSAIFFLLACQLFLSPVLGWKKILASALLFLITLFTYEQVILFPSILLMLAYFEKDLFLKKRQYIYSFCICFAGVIYVFARRLITSEIVGTYEGNNFNSLNLSTLALNAIQLVFRLFINPSVTRTFIVSALILCIILAIIIWHKKKDSNHQFLLIYCSILSILLIPIVSLGITIRSFESGRYLYIPSIFLVIGLAIIIQQNITSSVWVKGLTVFICCYWFWGKYNSSIHFKAASSYVKSTYQIIDNHFQLTPNTSLTIDTLNLTIHRLPVFRMGFKSGIHWLRPAVDTNKVIVHYYEDEFLKAEIK